MLALDSLVLESLWRDADLAKVRVYADALGALLSVRASLYVRGLVCHLVHVLRVARSGLAILTFALVGTVRVPC